MYVNFLFESSFDAPVNYFTWFLHYHCCYPPVDFLFLTLYSQFDCFYVQIVRGVVNCGLIW